MTYKTKHQPIDVLRIAKTRTILIVPQDPELTEALL